MEYCFCLLRCLVFQSLSTGVDSQRRSLIEAPEETRCFSVLQAWYDEGQDGTMVCPDWRLVPLGGKKLPVATCY